MRNLSSFLLVTLLSLPVATSWATGYTGILGKLDGDWEVFVDTEPPITVWVWKKNGTEKDSHEYKNEGCTLTSDFSNPKQEVRLLLSCPANGSTPIAGTRYVGYPFHGNCEKGDPEFLYKCVAGSGPKSRAPKTMRQAYWEC